MRPPESVIGYFMRMRQQPNPTVAVETNGRGFIGFIVDLPGGYVRGKTEAEAVSKAGLEVSRYLAWVGLDRGLGGGGGGGGMPRSFVVQRQTTTASVDQGDTMMLLDADRPKMRPEEFRALSDLVLYSGETFESAYQGAKLKSWTDESRLPLPTFYGQRPCTIEQVYSHVRRTQTYYLSRLGLPLQDGDFMMMRRLAVNSLRNEFEHGARGSNGSSSRALVTLEGETWTLRKVLRRFVWHDRIHAKAILRIMRRQEQLGLVGTAVGELVVDPFHFSSLA
jgi:hypothetical protein